MNEKSSEPSKTAIKRSEKGTFLPGNPGGPGHPKGVRNRAALIHEAKLQLCQDLLEAQPSKRFYKRWLRNYAMRHPKEALELVASIIGKLDVKEKADSHINVNLAVLVAAARKRAEELRGS